MRNTETASVNLRALQSLLKDINYADGAIEIFAMIKDVSLDCDGNLYIILEKENKEMVFPIAKLLKTLEGEAVKIVIHSRSIKELWTKGEI